MADGETWKRLLQQDSFSKASGDADELFCDPCKCQGSWKVPEGYCKVCDEYLCDNCLGVHRNQKISKTHTILGKKQMPSSQEDISNQDMCVEMCKTHYPEIIRFYCKAHDEPGCGDCMTLTHPTCKKDRVQDISIEFQKTTELKDIIQQLEQFHQELKDVEIEMDKNVKNLDTTYNNILRKITSIRKQLNEYLDQVEEKLRDEAAKMKKEDKTKLETWQAENQAMKADIKQMLQTLHDTNANVNSLFVITKQAKHRLTTMEKEITKIKEANQQHLYEFLISNEIENIISAKTPLGKLSRKPSTTEATATHNRSINVKSESDKMTCVITDCALVSADMMVVMDLTNQSVKLIDLRTDTLVSSYSPSSAPRGVTALSTKMIAVTLPNVGKIQVLNVTTTFTLQCEIEVNNNCRAIAYKDGKFAVGFVQPGRVNILDTEGEILHSLDTNQDAELIPVLRSPSYITFGHDNDTVIVSDSFTKNLSVVTFSGQILHTYKHDTCALNDPRGIVITADGKLFVCNWDGGCIHVISPDFKTGDIIISKDSHVIQPESITYCQINHTLYISDVSGGDLNNQIQVYDLKV